LPQNKAKGEIAQLRQEVHELKLTLNQVHDHNFNISPLPSADELLKMEQIEIGITNRILSMAEQQLERTHSHNMELAQLEKSNQEIIKIDTTETIKARTRSQWMSFALIVIGFSSATYMSSKGQELGAIATIIGSITPIIIAFLSSHKK